MVMEYVVWRSHFRPSDVTSWCQCNGKTLSLLLRYRLIASALRAGTCKKTPIRSHKIPLDAMNISKGSILFYNAYLMPFKHARDVYMMSRSLTDAHIHGMQRQVLVNNQSCIWFLIPYKSTGLICWGNARSNTEVHWWLYWPWGRLRSLKAAPSDEPSNYWFCSLWVIPHHSCSLFSFTFSHSNWLVRLVSMTSSTTTLFHWTFWLSELESHLHYCRCLLLRLAILSPNISGLYLLLACATYIISV